MNDRPGTDEALQTIEDRLRTRAHEIAARILGVKPEQSHHLRQCLVRLDHDIRDLSQRFFVIDRSAAGQGGRKALGLAEMRHGLAQWPNVRALLQGMADFGPVPLYPVPAEVPGTQAALVQSGDHFFELLHYLVNPLPQDRAAAASGAHPDIPLDLSLFMAHMHAARRVCLAGGATGPLRFLDIGCGGGLKVVAARQVFEIAEGIEIDSGYVDMAAKVLASPHVNECGVTCADGLEFDGYGEFDVIYLFKPIRPQDVMARLERRMVRAARPGTVIVAPYREFAERHPEMNCRRISGDLYVTDLDAAAAAELHARAEYIGTSVRRARHPAAAMWEPALEALFRRGFAAA